MVEGLDLDGLLLELVEHIPWSALASAPEGDRQWFTLSTTSSQIANSSLHQMKSSAVLPLPQQTMSPTPSSTPPEASQALMNQKKAQTNMDESPSSQPALPQADGEVTDTRPDASPDASADDDSTVNDSRDDGVDEQEQRSNHVDEMVAQTESQPDATVQSTKTSRLKRTSTPPKKALRKRQRRPGIMDHEDYMPSSEPSRETALGYLLAAGESCSMPIDVEAVDMLMRNFPIIEEHQVRCAGYNSLKPYIIIF
jgi:hypothetical protein